MCAVGSVDDCRNDRLGRRRCPLVEDGEAALHVGAVESRARIDKSVHYYEGILPQQVFLNVAEAGGTVFVGGRRYNPLHARYAKEAGLHYFGAVYVNELPNISGGRTCVKQNGEDYWFKCPLDQTIYEKWLVEPYMRRDSREVDRRPSHGLGILWRPRRSGHLLLRRLLQDVS